jgi:hypothetical protein
MPELNCAKCHSCGADLGGDEWCSRCHVFRRYWSHGWRGKADIDFDACRGTDRPAASRERPRGTPRAVRA